MDIGVLIAILLVLGYLVLYIRSRRYNTEGFEGCSTCGGATPGAYRVGM
jgi:hypothetical protein